MPKSTVKKPRGTRTGTHTSQRPRTPTPPPGLVTTTRSGRNVHRPRTRTPTLVRYVESSNEEEEDSDDDDDCGRKNSGDWTPKKTPAKKGGAKKTPAKKPDKRKGKAPAKTVEEGKKGLGMRRRMTIKKRRLP
jgi:hypothetical protein